MYFYYSSVYEFDFVFTCTLDFRSCYLLHEITINFQNNDKQSHRLGE
jgi:hypothetical protein